MVAKAMNSVVNLCVWCSYTGMYKTRPGENETTYSDTYHDCVGLVLRLLLGTRLWLCMVVLVGIS